jgi:hypothetical protein
LEKRFGAKMVAVTVHPRGAYRVLSAPEQAAV